MSPMEDLYLNYQNRYLIQYIQSFENLIDQYNNNINFSLNIVAKNDVFKKGTFKIPEIN